MSSRLAGTSGSFGGAGAAVVAARGVVDAVAGDLIVGAMAFFVVAAGGIAGFTAAFEILSADFSRTAGVAGSTVLEFTFVVEGDPVLSNTTAGCAAGSGFIASGSFFAGGC